jgi:hypothetical protein
MGMMMHPFAVQRLVRALTKDLRYDLLVAMISTTPITAALVVAVSSDVPQCNGVQRLARVVKVVDYPFRRLGDPALSPIVEVILDSFQPTLILNLTIH